MIKIAVIAPVVGVKDPALDRLERYGGPDIELREIIPTQTPLAVASDADSARAAVPLMKCAAQAQEEGADAIVINCMADPALYAICSTVSIPVIGSGEAALKWASVLGGRIAWINVTEERRMVDRQVATCGVQHHYVAHTYIDIPVLELNSNPDLVFERLVHQARQAISAHQANTFILGCTELTDLRKPLDDILNKECSAVDASTYQVLAGLPIAISIAASMVWLNTRPFV